MGAAGGGARPGAGRKRCVAEGRNAPRAVGMLSPSHGPCNRHRGAHDPLADPTCVMLLSFRGMDRVFALPDLAPSLFPLVPYAKLSLIWLVGFVDGKAV